MSTIRRASTFSVRTYVPADLSFSAMIAPRLEMSAVDGECFAQACMTFRTWRALTLAANTVMAARAIGGFGATIELSYAENGMAAIDVPHAEGVRVHCVEDGSPALEFLDGEGRVFAVAVFSPDTFSRLIGESCDLLEVVMKGGLATAPCKGSA